MLRLSRVLIDDANRLLHIAYSCTLAPSQCHIFTTKPFARYSQTTNVLILSCETKHHPSFPPSAPASLLQVNTPSASLVNPGGLPVARTVKYTFAHSPHSSKSVLISSSCIWYSGFSAAILRKLSRCAAGVCVGGKTSMTPAWKSAVVSLNTGFVKSRVLIAVIMVRE